MKKMLIIAIFAFCGLSFAQLLETTTQVGQNNSAIVTQSGTGLSLSAVNQNGDLNLANVITDGSVTNTITQLQTTNNALQSLTGVGTTAEIYQKGTSNFGQQSNINSADLSSSLELKQIGDNNISYQEMIDSRENTSKVSQQGTYNESYLLQNGMSSTHTGNYASVDQQGDFNKVGSGGAFFTQIGYRNTLVAIQNGTTNDLEGYQQGYKQAKYVKQLGENNLGIINEIGATSGNNGGYLYQDGQYNYANQYQYGNNLCGFTDQRGDHNSITLNQQGDFNCSHSFQYNSNNIATITQNGTGLLSTTTQTGNSNITVVNQN